MLMKAQDFAAAFRVGLLGCMVMPLTPLVGAAMPAQQESQNQSARQAKPGNQEDARATIVRSDQAKDAIRMYLDLSRRTPDKVPEFAVLNDGMGVVVKGSRESTDRFIEFVEMLERWGAEKPAPEKPSVRWIDIPEGVELTKTRMSMLMETLKFQSRDVRMEVEDDQLALFSTPAVAESAKMFLMDLKARADARPKTQAWTLELSVLGPKTEASSKTPANAPSESIAKAAAKLGLADAAVLGGLQLNTHPTSGDFRGKCFLQTGRTAFLNVDGQWRPQESGRPPMIELMLSVESQIVIGEQHLPTGKTAELLDSTEVLELSTEVIPVDQKTFVIGRGATPEGTLVFVLKLSTSPIEL